MRPILTALLACAAGCAPAEPVTQRAAIDLPLAVLADTGATLTMPAAPWPAASPSAHARATLTHVAPTRAEIDVALPAADPAQPEAVNSERERGGGLMHDDGLQPPIPRGVTPLRLPAARRGWVELDVRVDERGEVSDAELFASSTDDSAAAAAAIQAALAMRFHPALQRGEPVAVWARQRFEFGSARAPR